MPKVQKKAVGIVVIHLFCKVAKNQKTSPLAGIW